MSLSISDAVVSFFHSETIRKTFGNPITVGIIIVAVIILIMYSVLFPQVELVDPSVGGIGYFMATVGIYTFLAALGIMYLHHNVLKEEMETKYARGEAADIVKAAVENREISELRHLKPMTNFDKK